MAWTETTRARYERHSGRYASYALFAAGRKPNKRRRRERLKITSGAALR